MLCRDYFVGGGILGLKSNAPQGGEENTTDATPENMGDRLNPDSRYRGRLRGKFSERPSYLRLRVEP